MSTSKSKRSALNNSATSTPMKPIAKQAKMQDPNDQSYEELFALISSMKEKLKKLDKLDIIENRLNTIDNKISELKYSLTYQQETATEIQKEQSNKIAQLESTVAKIEEEKDKPRDCRHQSAFHV